MTTPNYTPEMVEKMYDAYIEVREADQDTRNRVVKEIAVELGKKPKSVQSKLSRMFVKGTETQLYVSKVKVSSVTGEAARKKAELGVELASLVNPAVPAEVEGVKVARVNAENLAKLNKTDLQALIVFARAAVDAASEAAEGFDPTEE